ncbi:hypothetical protein MD484_g6575, partial [Candolleomyces efflorescens]
MTTPIRKKRNFKALQLNVGGGDSTVTQSASVGTQQQQPAAPDPNALSLRTAPTATGPGLKKRPPPMTLKAPKINSHSGMVSATTLDDISGSPNGAGGAGGATGGANGNGNGNGNFLVISSGPSSAPLTATHLNVNVRRNTLNAKLANLEANNAGVHTNGGDLDATEEEDGAAGEGSSKGAGGSGEGGEEKKKGGRVKFQLKNEDLVDIKDLGSGNGGSVKKVEHLPTKTYMAKKTVLIDAKPSVQKQIIRELQIMDDCHSKYIVSFYGAFLADPNICICMEFMDKGSLDGIYKETGPIDIDVVGKIALAVLEGLTYLYDVHRIIHRDIKPSNILCNSKGQIKICDFGVSGELINSIADTFVGTSTYMSPERIQGAQYTVKSDVWSLGISLIELALGRFPFSQSESDDESDSDFEGTLSPATMGSLSLNDLPVVSEEGDEQRPLPPPRRRPKKTETTKKDKRRSKGHIVNEPAPRLTPEGRYPKEAELFIDACLMKKPEERMTPKDLLLPDLDSLSLTYASSQPHRQTKTQSIPIPTASGVDPQRERGRVAPDPFSSADLLDYTAPARGTPYYKTQQQQAVQQRRIQELYNQANIPAADPEPPKVLGSPAFVQEVVRSSIPVALQPKPKVVEGQPVIKPEPVAVKIVWRGGGHHVLLARAGDDEWKGRQVMERESPGSPVFATMVNLLPGTHHIRFLVDDQWRVADDLPTAVDDQGSLANYVAVPFGSTKPKDPSFFSESAPTSPQPPKPPSERPNPAQQAQWTSVLPPELLEAFKEEEMYLAANQGQIDPQNHHHRTS